LYLEWEMGVFADLIYWLRELHCLCVLGTCKEQETETGSDVIMVETNTCMYARDLTQMQVYVAYITTGHQYGYIIMIRLYSTKAQVHAKLDRHVSLKLTSLGTSNRVIRLGMSIIAFIKH
jgi:hypothetical protein